MDRVAVFVDAGYLFAEGSRLLSGDRLGRSRVRLNHERVVQILTELCADLSPLPLLRVYWYDASSGAPGPAQSALAYQAFLKLRLGSVNEHGEQKGVDSLISSDLVELARNKAIADAVLIAGDEDLRLGIAQAQAWGTRVHLVAVGGSLQSQSRRLVQESDSLREWSRQEVRELLSVHQGTVREAVDSMEQQVESPSEETWMTLAVERFRRELTSRERTSVARLEESTGIPSDLDRKLLIAASAEKGGVALTVHQKRCLRTAVLQEKERWKNT